MKNSLAFALATTATLSFVAPASAAVISSTMPGDASQSNQPHWTNQHTGQNFLVQFSLSQATALNRMTILAGSGYWALGNEAYIKLRADSGGSPALINLADNLNTVTGLSIAAPGIDAVTVDFSPLTLAAGTYWIGLSSATLGVWATYREGRIDPQTQFQLNGDTLQGPPAIHTLAYSLEGNLAGGAVPEPSAWAILVLGFGAAGGVMRARRRTAAFA